MQANDKQIGGEHYKAQYQHWDYVTDLKLPYMLAQLTRYVLRWKKKNGLEDVRKAIHYNQKEREHLMERKKQYQTLTKALCEANNIGEHERLVLEMVADYHAGQLGHLHKIDVVLNQMLEILEGKPMTVPNVIKDPEFLEDRCEWRK